MPDQLVKDTKELFQGALDHLHSEFSKIQTGRANAALVENIMVDSYGSLLPLKGLANISVPEAKQIVIQPWDRDQVTQIEKAIRDAGLGFNPKNEGLLLRIMLAPLTEERRKDLVKVVHQYAEEARISIRNSRHDAMSELKRLEKDKEISEDVLNAKEEEIQKIVDEFNKKIEEAAKKKEADVMTV